MLLIAISYCIRAGTVQGILVEHASGRPLSRTVVRLDPVPNSAGQSGKSIVTRTGRIGNFIFPIVPSGLYFLTASREGYFPAAYGQRLPAGRGVPVAVTADSTLTAELRMRHKAALTGRILDENGVGAPGVSVVAYRARLPLRTAGSGISDDRGVFRIAGLDPGKFWVRSGPHVLGDGSGWMPTFATQSTALRNARTYQIAVDTEATDADVFPEPGAVFELSGVITCEKPGFVQVTLSSDTIQKSSRVACPITGGYSFNNLSAGDYEILATSEADGSAAFTEFTLGGNLRLPLTLHSMPEIEIEVWRDASGAVTNIPVKLIGRPLKLSGSSGDMVEIAKRTRLAPGFWELRAMVPAGHYVTSIANIRSFRLRRGAVPKSSSAYETLIDSQRPALIRVSISDQAGRIEGSVKSEGKPVPGAPVFLWPVAESARRSLGESIQTVTDTEGNFSFADLPPGDYRVLSSFDVNEFDDEVAQLSNAPTLTCKGWQAVAIELTPWIAPY
jgi:hypothetical protein